MTVEERQVLGLNIKKLSELWPIFVSKKVTAKFDCLVMQVMQIIENMDGFTGSISEQSIERLHNVVNQEARVVHNIADRAKKAKHLMNLLVLSQSASKSKIAEGISVKPRTFLCCKTNHPYNLKICPNCLRTKRGSKRNLSIDFNASSNLEDDS